MLWFSFQKGWGKKQGHASLLIICAVRPQCENLDIWWQGGGCSRNLGLVSVLGSSAWRYLLLEDSISSLISYGNWKINTSFKINTCTYLISICPLPLASEGERSEFVCAHARVCFSVATFLVCFDLPHAGCQADKHGQILIRVKAVCPLSAMVGLMLTHGQASLKFSLSVKMLMQQDGWILWWNSFSKSAWASSWSSAMSYIIMYIMNFTETGNTGPCFWSALRLWEVLFAHTLWVKFFLQ